MGYTHYFSGKQNFTDQEWDNISRDFSFVQEHLKHDAPIVCDHGSGVIMNERRINFNDAHNAYETFNIPKIKNGFGFCKTARHDYDLMVCATLLLINHHAPDAMEISSDGDPEDWLDAMMVNAKLFGYAYKLPTSVYDSHEASAADCETSAQEKAEAFLAVKMTQRKPQSDTTNIKNRFSL